MRKSNLSSQEIAELDELKAEERRASGLALGQVRDRGWARLRNNALVFWHHPKTLGTEVNSIKIYNSAEVPPGCFGIMIDGKKVIFDAEELRKFLRWA